MALILCKISRDAHEFAREQAQTVSLFVNLLSI